MGYAEVIFPNGKGTRVVDGVEYPIKVEMCDKCEAFGDMKRGFYQLHQGEKILWYCEACK